MFFHILNGYLPAWLYGGMADDWLSCNLEQKLYKLHDRLLLLGFVLESINKLLHTNSVSKNYCLKSSFTVADMLYGINVKYM